MSQGQINYEDNQLGKHIVNICKLPDVKTIVEIGTWNGLGSTRCVIQGINESKKIDYNFISIECNHDMYIEALKNNPHAHNNIKFIYGKIVNENIIDKWFNVNDLTQEQYGWLLQDIEWMKQVPNVYDNLPAIIDFLILDGGEFSTYPEWLALKHKVRYVALDDVTQLKCKRLRDEILNDVNYEIIDDNIAGSRYGYTIFKLK